MIPGLPDDRSYDYAAGSRTEREEYPHIAALVPRGSRVLDLGCGDGSLLAHLREARGTSGVGLELAASGVAAARARGIDAREGRADRALEEFREGEFGVAVCNVTLQMVERPELLLAEMARVARGGRVIVGFPNFAHYRNRLDLLLRGRFPRPLLFGHRWYDTGHIHPFSRRDLLELASAQGLTLETERVVAPTGWKGRGAACFPDLLAQIVVAAFRA